MVREERHEGTLTIAWGYDEPCDFYFFDLSDSRLAWHGDDNDEASAFFDTVDRSGGGMFVDVYAGRGTGTGKQVSVAVMCTLWKRYGVPAEHVDALLKDRSWQKR
jgi:hypothetical protein